MYNDRLQTLYVHIYAQNFLILLIQFSEYCKNLIKTIFGFCARKSFSSTYHELKFSSVSSILLELLYYKHIIYNTSTKHLSAFSSKQTAKSVISLITFVVF